jgi:hypothetical protein
MSLSAYHETVGSFYYKYARHEQEIDREKYVRDDARRTRRRTEEKKRERCYRSLDTLLPEPAELGQPI